MADREPLVTLEACGPLTRDSGPIAGWSLLASFQSHQTGQTSEMSPQKHTLRVGTLAAVSWCLLAYVPHLPLPLQCGDTLVI